MNEEFSLKWFGIPDKDVVAFWKKLESAPRFIPHDPKDDLCLCRKCGAARAEQNRRALQSPQSGLQVAL